jgi:hypothetical protein
MMKVMRKIAVAMVFIFSALAPLTSWADDQTVVDGRLQGYDHNVTLSPSGTGVYWLLMFFLALITVVGLFKSAKRTHLD